MLAKILIAPLFIAAGVAAHPAQPELNRRGDVSLSQWQSQNLESFWRFKNRYSALGCANQKDTDFYTKCCYPLGASENLSDRPAECTPSSSTCDVPSPTVSSTTTNTETYTDQSYDDDDYDESNLPYCVEGQGEYDDAPTYSPDSYTPPANNYTPPADTYTPPAADNYTPPAADPTPDNSSNNNNNNNNNNNSGSTGGDEQTGGFATFYYQNGNPGACGNYNNDYALIAAMEISRYGNTGNASPLCGRSVHITNTNNGRSVDVIVADACPSCVNGNSIDLSVGAFQALADLGEGMVPISWHFN